MWRDRCGRNHGGNGDGGRDKSLELRYDLLEGGADFLLRGGVREFQPIEKRDELILRDHIRGRVAGLGRAVNVLNHEASDSDKELHPVPCNRYPQSVLHRAISREVDCGKYGKQIAPVAFHIDGQGHSIGIDG